MNNSSPSSPSLPLALELPDALVELLVERVRDSMPPPSEFLDVEGLAQYLGTKPRHVRFMRERGLPARLVGRKLWFKRLEVEDWIDGQERV